MNAPVADMIPYFIVLPLTVAVLVQLLARRRDALAAGLAGLCMLALALMSLAAALSGAGGEVVYNMGGWATPIGIDLRLDGLATLLLLAIQRYVVRETGSVAIRADSLHYLTDLLTNLVTIVAIALVMAGFQYGMQPWIIASMAAALTLPAMAQDIRQQLSSESVIEISSAPAITWLFVST